MYPFTPPCWCNTSLSSAHTYITLHSPNSSFHTNIGSDIHVMTFASETRFGMVERPDVGSCGVE